MSEIVELSPNPVNFLESLRNIGYSMETAIADIIDNSITAEASDINIDFDWSEGRPWIAICDNGYGMNKETLINAMKFGSMNPNDVRQQNDLGRFGLGMKTASISQSRRLTVLTIKNGETNISEWDMDFISQNPRMGWSLRILGLEDLQKRASWESLGIDRLYRKSGTFVMWDKIDRMHSLEQESWKENNFNSIMSKTREHLQETFHRFISPDIGTKKIKIRFNNDDLLAYDPYNTHNPATQELLKQDFRVDNIKIAVQPYVLAHHSKSKPNEYRMYGGKDGYLHNQGFYIYRNKRLIIKGSWFGLIKKEELSKLIRVKVDFPNSLDHLWSIDVLKSKARPPKRVLDKLKVIVRRIETAGKNVYTQRGHTVRDDIAHPGWKRKIINDEIFYEINKEHPLYLKVNDSVIDTKILNSFSSMLESSFPKDLYYRDFASEPEKMNKKQLSYEELRELFFLIEPAFKEIKDFDTKLQKLKQMEPFSGYPKECEEILKEESNED